ncbi:MAG TPA: ABC transporter ATP-binding protein [Methanocella sp.]|jgi:energy-coupling factor transport system ATP-binding protein
MQNDPVIDIRGLSYQHPAGPGEPRGKSLDCIDLSIRAGEFVVITGPSGCGKSTLCRCIAGLIPHADRGTMGGEVFICGNNTRDHPPGWLAGLVALTFQSPDDQLFSNSVEAEIAFGPEHMGLKPSEIDARIAQALEAADAGHLRRRLVDELSGGEKQRVAIAAALALKPSVLVLDEPTSELDPVAAADLIAMLHRLNRDQGMTVLVIEHRLERLYGTMSRLVVLNRGKVVLDGPPDDIFSHDLAPLGIAVPPIAAFRKRFGAGPYAGTWRSEPRSRPSARGRCAVAIRNVEFTYSRAGKKTLDGVTLGFFCGEVAVIMGANGSGKTTLIKHFNGLLRPDRGEVYIDGRPIAGRTVAQIARQAGIVFQSPDRQLFAETVHDELAFGPGNSGMNGGEIERSVTETADSLEIGLLLREPPFMLSGGEKQRVAIGSVLTLHPLVLALDEPTLGLGHGMKERLAAILRSLATSGRAIVVVTHDVEFAAAHADRVIVLAGGRVAADGSSREVLASEDLLRSSSLHMPQAMAIGKSVGLEGVLSLDEICQGERQ